MAATNNKQGDLTFAADLFPAADKLRQNVEPSEYKHIVLVAKSPAFYAAPLAHTSFHDRDIPQAVIDIITVGDAKRSADRVRCQRYCVK